MRLSPKRHPLAVLRILLKLCQKELGDLALCSKATVQAVELGKLRLSEDLAGRIASATGVNVEWLLNGDPSIPPQAYDGGEYTLEKFEFYRANTSSPGRLSTALQVYSVYWWMCRLDGIMTAAKIGSRANIISYRVNTFIKELAAEFGEDEEAMESHRRNAAIILQRVLGELEKTGLVRDAFTNPALAKFHSALENWRDLPKASKFISIDLPFPEIKASAEENK
jgi:transcriptional regulator with XRE-family HTH domain